MHIMVGMGSIDDYESYVEAGADEIFIGYVPSFWMKKYGRRYPLNRREVLYYNVQIGSKSELLILRDMMNDHKIPVTITINALSYLPNQYEDIYAIMKECMEMGFSHFILADWALIQKVLQVFPREKYPKLSISISGEYGELNHRILEEFLADEKKKDGRISRVIFPRQTEISEMKEMISHRPELEYEAFFLNEKCHFTGAYCNSFHCDEMCHMCQVNYKWEGDYLLVKNEKRQDFVEEEDGLLGWSGCGFCALWKLKKAGVSTLKIVSRGQASEECLRDIQAVCKALKILQECQSEEEYIFRMKKLLFPISCSGNCYYRK